MTTHTGTLALEAKSWWPTRKWWAATITAVAGMLVTLSTTGWEMSTAMQGTLITLGAQRIIAYLIPNEDTIGGVPGKKAK
jgi:hypothetical protein